MQQFDRTEKLIGKEAVAKLQNSHVAVFGLGGVGSFTVEALVRAGVGTLTLVDSDKFEETNLNRQLFALHSTLGQFKAEVAKCRAADINPLVKVNAVCRRFDKDTQGEFDFSQFDYVVDAIDTVTSKLLLIQRCKEAQTPIISCMGTGNKLDATAFVVADISQTSVCPLAKVMRKELKARGIEHVKVVYSAEQPLQTGCESEQGERRKQTPSSISFVPSVAGLVLAGEVIKSLVGSNR